MKKIVQIILAVVIVVGIVGVSSSVYIISEDEVAVIKFMGKINKVIVNVKDEKLVLENIKMNDNPDISVSTKKGLQFKIPFLQDVKKYDSKYLTYKSRGEKTNTKDGRSIDIQMYAQYRIVDPAKFNQSVIEESRANVTVMDKRLYPVVIQSANALIFDEFFRNEMLESLIDEKLDSLNGKLLDEFGLYVRDVGVNRKTFPESNIESIEQKMSKQIEKESEKFIAEGDSAYQKAKATTDRQRKELIAGAVEKAAIIKANADAEAARIYQKSLQKDLEFYKFIQRMNIYKEIENTTIFLDKDNDLLEYINGY